MAVYNRSLPYVRDKPKCQECCAHGVGPSPCGLYSLKLLSLLPSPVTLLCVQAKSCLLFSFSTASLDFCSKALRRLFFRVFIFFCKSNSSSSRQLLNLIDDPNHQRTTRTDSNFLAIPQILNVDFETIATGAWISVELSDGVVGHVFNLDFVVDARFGGVDHFCGGSFYFVGRAVLMRSGYVSGREAAVKDSKGGYGDTL